MVVTSCNETILEPRLREIDCNRRTRSPKPETFPIARKITLRFHAAARTRTWDNLGNNQVLYQLSYGGFTPT
jgi:hypothetical protein